MSAEVVALLWLAPMVRAQVGFQGPTNFAVGRSPVSVAVGDFNADSDPDLAVANLGTAGSGGISVLLGGAGGSFGTATNFAAGSFPGSVAVGDFNADSDPDLAVANAGSDNVSVLLGGAGGSFGTATNFAAGDSPSSVAVGDFNADSDPDLAVANSDSDNVSVLLGGAGGSFGTATNLAVGDVPSSVAVGDFNADSDPDLAGANSDSDNVSVLLGGAGGSFGTATNFAAPDGPNSVAVGDFNADSDPDLATTNTGSSNVSVLLGGAGGSFGTATNFAADGPNSVAVGDFNADSDPDLAGANAGSDNVSVLLGGAGGSFGTPINFAAGNLPYWIAVGDFNADADPDLAVTNAGSDNVSVLLNSLHAPTAPTLTGTDPASPANDNSPNVKGTAEAGSTVRLYTSSDCSGTPAATGSAAEFASPGLAVAVLDDSSTSFRATATKADVFSQCSDSLTYVEDSAPPSAAIGLSTNLALTGETVTFDASASSDQPGGAVALYEWDLDGDGSFETDTGTSPTTSRSFSAPAEITPGVRVTSSFGQSDVTRTPLAITRRPPPGQVGVSINAGARFTNDRDVRLSLVWPAYVVGALISNDGGFAPSTTLPVDASVPWRLDSAGSERLPKTVYVRFEAGTQTFAHYILPLTFTDDIILDETRPTVQAATFVRSGGSAATARRGKRRYRIRLRARDNVAGIVGYQVTTKRRKPGKLRRLSRRRLTVRRTIAVRAGNSRLYVRVRDAAGNNSKWRRVKRSRRRR